MAKQFKVYYYRKSQADKYKDQTKVPTHSVIVEASTYSEAQSVAEKVPGRIVLHVDLLNKTTRRKAAKIALTESQPEFTSALGVDALGVKSDDNISLVSSPAIPENPEGASTNDTSAVAAGADFSGEEIKDTRHPFLLVVFLLLGLIGAVVGLSVHNVTVRDWSLVIAALSTITALALGIKDSE